MVFRLRAMAVGWCVLAAGCPGGDTGAQEGFETGPCIEGACLGGLVCMSNQCVDPGGDGSGGSAPESSDGQLPLPPPADDDGPDASSTSAGQDGPLDSTSGAPDPDPSTSSSGGQACAFVNDGVCDEPEGTGLCPEGSDEDDCALPTCTGDPAASPAPCDVFEQDCPTGEKCMPYATGGGQSWNATGCFPIDCDAVGPGDTCEVVGSGVSGIDDCEPSTMCWSVDTGNEGYCIEFCSGTPNNPSCAAADTTCVITNGGVLALCLLACDPIAQDCTTGEMCAPVNDVFACAPDASGALGAFGDACAFINACDPGNACLAQTAFSNCANASGCCSVICDVSDGGADAMCAALDAAQSCEPWFVEGQAPPGYENVGVCTIPQ